MAALNDEGPSGGALGLQGTNGTTDAPSLPQAEAGCKAARDAIDKRFATLRAHAALAGFELFVIDGASGTEFAVSRWGWCRTFANLDAAADWLALVGVRP